MRSHAAILRALMLTKKLFLGETRSDQKFLSVDRRDLKSCIAMPRPKCQNKDVFIKDSKQPHRPVVSMQTRCTEFHGRTPFIDSAYQECGNNNLQDALGNVA